MSSLFLTKPKILPQSFSLSRTRAHYLWCR
jgi:hypothetical protein